MNWFWFYLAGAAVDAAEMLALLLAAEYQFASEPFWNDTANSFVERPATQFQSMLLDTSRRGGQE